jgi:molybdate transport system regulatory protein
MTRSIRGILKKNKSFTVNGSLWIECNGKKFFGPGPVELLERIHETGSISQAAKQMEMSYKKAWEIITTLNTNAVQPFVITQAGGSSGGGSTISDEAKTMITWYRKVRKNFSIFLEREMEKLGA